MDNRKSALPARVFQFTKDQFVTPNQSFVRFVLAATVVYGHFMFEITNLGNVAVFGFYTLSGFLITSAMRRSYSNGFEGFARFWQNRFWRLYPTYATVAALAFLGILLAPEAYSTARYAMTMPATIGEWLPQFTIVGLLGLEQATVPVRLLPPAWSLGIEIIYYLLISALIARHLAIALPFAVLAVISFAYMAATDGYSGVYLTYHGPAIAFMLGVLASFAKERLSVTMAPERMLAWSRLALIVLLLVLFGRELLIPTKFMPAEIRAPFDLVLGVEANILFLLLGSAATAFFCLMETRPARRSKTASFLGDLSYPLFLIHWPALGAAYALLHGTFGDAALVTVANPEISARFAAMFLGSRLMAVVIALALSCLIVLSVERALVPLRDRVRAKGQGAVPPPDMATARPSATAG